MLGELGRQHLVAEIAQRIGQRGTDGLLQPNGGIQRRQHLDLGQRDVDVAGLCRGHAVGLLQRFDDPVPQGASLVLEHGLRRLALVGGQVLGVAVELVGVAAQQVLQQHQATQILLASRR